jgi:hypothetical protein
VLLAGGGPEWWSERTSLLSLGQNSRVPRTPESGLARSGVMTREGDEVMGFSIAVEAGEIRIRGWGFWSLELCEQFAAALQREIGGLVKLAALRVDVAEMKPMRSEGQEAWAKALILMASKGIAKAALTEPQPLTKLQFVRLCKGAAISIQYI